MGEESPCVAEKAYFSSAPQEKAFCYNTGTKLVFDNEK